MEKLTTPQIKVARLIQQDIPVVSSPFEMVGNECGIPAKEALSTVKYFLQEGFIRKFCAILRHQKAGYRKNALVVWSVPKEQVEKSGELLSAFDFISHCYERNPAFRGKYNLFTMIHSKDEDILSLINKIKPLTGIKDYLILESIHEYKKKSPEYL